MTTTEQPHEGTQEPTEDQKAEIPSRREARYRTERNEAQAQAQSLTTQRDDLARQLIETRLPNRLSAEIFWRLADEPSSFLTEAGQLNDNAVKSAADQIAEDLGLNAGPVVMTQGKSPENPRIENTFQEAFKPKSQRNNPEMR